MAPIDTSDIKDINILRIGLNNIVDFDICDATQLFVAFVLYTESKITEYRSSPSFAFIEVICEYNDKHLVEISAYYYEDWKAPLFRIIGRSPNQQRGEILKLENNINIQAKEKLLSINGIVSILNQITNNCYKHFLSTISKQIEPKSQNTQEIKHMQETPQQIQPTPQISPPVPTIQEVPVVKQVQPLIAYDPNKLYIKKSNVTVVQDNIKCVIPNEYREIIKLYGKTRNDIGINRAVNLVGVISTIILRKNKNKSVLRHDRKNKTKLVLKIGTGQVFETEHDENFEWRVPHTEENVKHIENAFIELNKWVEEYKEKFAIKQRKDKEEEEKRKLEEEKRKLEEERKRKEQEEKIIQLIRTEHFAELK